eukprot:907739-Rhodomonas_salina.1
MRLRSQRLAVIRWVSLAGIGERLKKNAHARVRFLAVQLSRLLLLLEIHLQHQNSITPTTVSGCCFGHASIHGSWKWELACANVPS